MLRCLELYFSIAKNIARIQSCSLEAKFNQNFIFSNINSLFVFICFYFSEDILIFLTGKEEIEAAVVAARQAAKQLDDKSYPPLKVFPLYSQLPTHQQLDAFRVSAPGIRKLVISTNVAETSVTISG